MENIYFLRKSAKNDIMGKVRTGVKSWLSSWSFSRENDQVTVVESSECDYSCLFIGDNNNSIWFDISENLIQELVFPIFDEHPQQGEILSDILEEATCDFSTHIFSEISGRTHDLFQRSKLVQPEAKRKRHDEFLFLEITIKKRVIHCAILVGKWCESYRLAPQASHCHLEDRSNCSDNSRCELNVNLSLGAYNISLLENLAVGDVLDSKVSLESTFSVNVLNETVCRAYLGKKDKFKAVLVQPK